MDNAKEWAGQFGDEYTARQRVDVEARFRTLYDLLTLYTDGSGGVLEVGCGSGHNLEALQMAGFDDLCGVEVNCEAAGDAAGVIPVQNIIDGDWLEDGAPNYGGGQFDLVFTAGVLIHVPPDELREFMAEICRVSARYVLAIEYFRPGTTPTPLPYRGREGLMWGCDYGRRYMELGLKPVTTHFCWGVDSGFDDCVAWLMEKPEGWTRREG